MPNSHLQALVWRRFGICSGHGKNGCSVRNAAAVMGVAFTTLQLSISREMRKRFKVVDEGQMSTNCPETITKSKIARVH